jgi:hypothetical protein
MLLVSDYIEESHAVDAWRPARMLGAFDRQKPRSLLASGSVVSWVG